MALPVGRLQFAKPAVHAVRVVITRLHQLDQALLKNVGPVKDHFTQNNNGYSVQDMLFQIYSSNKETVKLPFI